MQDTQDLQDLQFLQEKQVTFDGRGNVYAKYNIPQSFANRPSRSDGSNKW